MSVIETIHEAVLPWINNGTATLTRQLAPDGDEYLELRPVASVKALLIDVRARQCDGIVSFADKSRQYDSVEFDEEEIEQLKGLVVSALSGDAKIALASFLGRTSPRSVQWPGGEWAFSMSVGRIFLPYRTRVVTFEGYS